MLTTHDIAQRFPRRFSRLNLRRNPLACAAGGAAFDLINTPEVLDGVTAKRELFVEHLQRIDARFDLFSDIRGMGLRYRRRVEAAVSREGARFLYAAAEAGVMVLNAGPDVMRFVPSLVIDDSDIAEGMARFALAVELGA